MTNHDYVGTQAFVQETFMAHTNYFVETYFIPRPIKDKMMKVMTESRNKSLPRAVLAGGLHISRCSFSVLVSVSRCSRCYRMMVTIIQG